MNDRQVARGLGWFSLGLGAAELLVPHGVARISGIDDKPRLTRTLGAREVAAGLAVLGPQDPGPGLWARVAGDALDLAVMSTGLKRRERRGRLLIAIGLVVGITALDLIYARRFTR